MTPHLNYLMEMVQMRGYKIDFCAEITKITPNYHQILPLIYFRQTVLIRRSQHLLLWTKKTKLPRAVSCLPQHCHKTAKPENRLHQTLAHQCWRSKAQGPTLLTNTLIFLVEKNERSFCTAKASHIFSTKNIGVFEILPFEILTKR